MTKDDEILDGPYIGCSQKSHLAMLLNVDKFKSNMSPVIEKTKPTPEGVIYDCLWGTTFDTDFEIKLTSSITDKK